MRVQAAVLLALAVASARAGEPPVAAPDPIAAAKKDFAGIKSSALAPDGASGLPSMDMKEMGPGPGGPPAAPTPLPSDKELSLDPTKKKIGTGNWLVDAMDKEADKDKKPDRARAFTPGEDLLKTDTELLLLENEKAGAHGKDSPAEARDKADPKEAPEQVYNPLTSFMGGWISARDHDLLLPNSKGAAADGDLAKGRLDPLTGPDPGQSGAFTEVFLPAPDAGGWSDPKAAANPYLVLADPEPASLARVFSSPEVPGFAPVGLGDAQRGAVSSGVDPRPLDMSRSFIPDFAQPTDDDKYFKQMKRF